MKDLATGLDDVPGLDFVEIVTDTPANGSASPGRGGKRPTEEPAQARPGTSGKQNNGRKRTPRKPRAAKPARGTAARPQPNAGAGTANGTKAPAGSKPPADQPHANGQKPAAAQPQSAIRKPAAAQPRSAARKPAAGPRQGTASKPAGGPQRGGSRPSPGAARSTADGSSQATERKPADASPQGPGQRQAAGSPQGGGQKPATGSGTGPLPAAGAQAAGTAHPGTTAHPVTTHPATTAHPVTTAHPATGAHPGTAAPPPLPKRPVPAAPPGRPNFGARPGQGPTPAAAPAVAAAPKPSAAGAANRTATRPVGAAPVAPGQGPAPAESVPPEEAVLDEELEELEEDLAKRRVPRRALLQAALIGGAGIAALPLLAVISRLTKPGPKPLALVYPLNDDWLFGGEYERGTEAADYDDTSFTQVTVPHSVAALSWRNWDPRAWQGIWIYRRHFNSTQLPGVADKQNRVFADFDGIMVNSTVIFNDQVIATHQGGYLPFQVELTGHVQRGANVLSVIVDSRAIAVPPMVSGTWAGNYDFLQPGGIYRDVNLRVVPRVYVSDLYAAPADVLSAQPRLDVQVTIDAAVKSLHPATLQVDLLDATDGSRLATTSHTVTINEPGVSVTKLAMSGLTGIKLWSPASPNLYNVQATLIIPEGQAHLATTRTGFRDARFRQDGFYLNGQRLQLFGLDRHQLYPYTGMAMPARAQRKDAEIIKTQFNCNMVRCSHYPQSPHFLDACDELGLMVWEEAPGWDHVSTSREWQDLVIQNVRDMVTRDRSRPSVIVWGTRLNETHKYPALWAATRQAAAELDPSRPSSGAMDDRNMNYWAEDVFGFNDYSFSKITGNAELQPPMPGVPYLVTEAVGVVEAQPEHFTWTDPPALLAKQGALHAQAHNLAAASQAYSGLIAWCAFDYGSLQGRLPSSGRASPIRSACPSQPPASTSRRSTPRSSP